MKPKQYTLAKASRKLSQKYIDFNLSAALKTGWLIEVGGSGLTKEDHVRLASDLWDKPIGNELVGLTVREIIDYLNK